MLHTRHIMNRAVGVRLPYLLALPDDYEHNTNTYPLLLFLHGAGERGSDLQAVRTQGLPRALLNGLSLPFIVVAPQCPVNDTWDHHRFGLTALLDEIGSQYRVDPDRVYLTGLSMGGFGTFDLAQAFPERFAALAPVCGGVRRLADAPTTARRLKSLPIWVFHGALDDIVPLAASEQIVDALKAEGADVQFTVYPDKYHDSWTVTYDNPELYAWFQKHRRGGHA